MEGALISKIVAATVRKIAKGQENLKIVGDFHMPLFLLQKVTDVHNENCVAVILVLTIVGLTDISLHVIIPLLFYFISLKIYLFLLIISKKVLILVYFYIAFFWKLAKIKKKIFSF